MLILHFSPIVDSDGDKVYWTEMVCESEEDVEWFFEGHPYCWQWTDSMCDRVELIQQSYDWLERGQLDLGFDVDCLRGLDGPQKDMCVLVKKEVFQA